MLLRLLGGLLNFWKRGWTGYLYTAGFCYFSSSEILEIVIPWISVVSLFERSSFELWESTLKLQSRVPIRYLKFRTLNTIFSRRGKNVFYWSNSSGPIVAITLYSLLWASNYHSFLIASCFIKNSLAFLSINHFFSISSSFTSSFNSAFTVYNWAFNYYFSSADFEIVIDQMIFLICSPRFISFSFLSHFWSHFHSTWSHFSLASSDS